jgi:hypothetical protein
MVKMMMAMPKLPAKMFASTMSTLVIGSTRTTLKRFIPVLSP